MSLEIRLGYQVIDKVKMLFQEYTNALGIDLDFQNYTDELLNLPGDYALPCGRLYIANYNESLAGLIALRPFDESCCEMKRLYVRPEYRKKGIGRALAERVISDAREMKYNNIVLDTLSSLTNSVSLYRKLGFQEIQPYRYNPVPNAIFFRLELL